MLLQAKKNRKRKQFFKKNRKGVSIMVGYVLLVVFAIILSLIAYQWIKTYVPSESLQCPSSGVSVSIKALYYDCEGGNNNLYLNVKNSGRFSILGYFAHAANVSEQEVATIDLSQYFNETLSGGQRFGNSIAFISAEENLFKPGDEKVAIFNLTDVGVLTSIQIIPTRMQEIDNKNRFISCGNEIVKQDIYCGMDTRIVDAACVPKTCGVDYECNGPWANGTCGGVLNCGDTCAVGVEKCNAIGQCEIDTCNEIWEQADIDAGFNCDGPAPLEGCTECVCDSGYIPNGIGGCTLVDNNICDPGETCADADCDGQQADECAFGQICQSESCEWQGGAYGEDEYCIDLGLGYYGGDCLGNTGQCTAHPDGVIENDEPGAEIYCPGQTLCCFTT